MAPPPRRRPSSTRWSPPAEPVEIRRPDRQHAEGNRPPARPPGSHLQCRGDKCGHGAHVQADVPQQRRRERVGWIGRQQRRQHKGDARATQSSHGPRQHRDTQRRQHGEPDHHRQRLAPTQEHARQHEPDQPRRLKRQDARDEPVVGQKSNGFRSTEPLKSYRPFVRRETSRSSRSWKKSSLSSGG